MDPYSFQAEPWRSPARWANNTSGTSAGHIGTRFHLPHGNVSEVPRSPACVVEDSDGKRRLENEDDYRGRPLTASEAEESDRASSVVSVHDLGLGAASPASLWQLSDLYLDDSIMDAEEVRRYLSLAPCLGTSVRRSIRDKIISSQQYSKASSKQDSDPYLPIDEFEMIFSLEPIKALVKEEFSPRTDAEFRIIMDQISSRRRILGTLLCADNLKSFQHFVEEDISDCDLPLKPEHTKEQPATRTRTSDEVNRTLLESWEPNQLVLFYYHQPAFFVPFFDISGDRLLYHTFDHQIRLPWLMYEHKTSGGNGIVHKVEIHPSHHNLKSVHSSGNHLYFALKEIDTHDEEIYRQEFAALQKGFIHSQKEPHLIKLLLTFTHGSKYYFLFEWADGNLEEYWEKHPEPSERTLAKSQWAAKQCLGLASALKQIQGRATWQNQRRSSSLGSLSPPSDVPSDDEREWGRHGDIKPNNILWFSSYGGEDDHLVLSDLGLTRYHSNVTRSLVRHTHIEGCTWPYRPPEMDMPGQHICQKYDIWSLGCVYLEFCIWWLKGLTAVRIFEGERAEKVEAKGVVVEDNYFVISHPGGKSKAEVKPIVLEWIRRLRELAVDDPFAGPMLRLIEEEMLVADKKRRSPADVICAAIHDIFRSLFQADSHNGLSSESWSGAEPFPQAQLNENYRYYESKQTMLTVDNLVRHATTNAESPSARFRQLTIVTNFGHRDCADGASNNRSTIDIGSASGDVTSQQPLGASDPDTEGITTQTATTEPDGGQLNAHYSYTTAPSSHVGQASVGARDAPIATSGLLIPAPLAPAGRLGRRRQNQVKGSQPTCNTRRWDEQDTKSLEIGLASFKATVRMRFIRKARNEAAPLAHPSSRCNTWPSTKLVSS